MIYLYSSDSCKKCEKVKDVLLENNLPFVLCNIKKPQYRLKLFKSGFAKVPVIEKDGKYYENIEEFMGGIK